MISTDDRSPIGRDSTTTRLNSFHNNNNNEEEDSSLYYQYVPSSQQQQHLHHISSPDQQQTLTTSQSTPIIHTTTPPSSPLPHRRHSQHHQQIILRDPHSGLTPNQSHHSLLYPNNSNNVISSSVVALPSSGPPATQPSNGITDLITHALSSRIIPKLGSIVKRFSLNYSGEGLVTDRQRTRTVRVGIRFQVQVDSFVNNRQQERPRAILRTQSAPAVEQLDSGFSSPTDVSLQNNRQLALEYIPTTGNKSISQSNCSSSTHSVLDCFCGSGGGEGNTCSTHSTSSGSGADRIHIGIGSGLEDSCSSGVSSESSSPTLERRANCNVTASQQQRNLSLFNHTHPNHLEQNSSSNNTLAFHNRINQALHSIRNQKQQTDQEQWRARRSSVQVYRRGSASPPERSNSITSDDQQSSNSGSGPAAAAMEDSSSYQVLRHFPGSNVNSLNELSWETAAFEKEIRDRIQWLGDKVSGIRVPRIITQLLDFGREYARENPVTALILLALCLTSSAPVLIFLVFAVATILVTFLGFLFVEGTLLTAATVIFGGVIVLVGFVTLTAVLVGMLGYFTTTQAYLVVTGRSQIFRLLRKLPLIGRFFPEPKPSPGEDEKEDQYSNFMGNGYVANGKVSNGHGPYHRPAANNTPYYVEEEDDDDDDDDLHHVLDSEDEGHVETEVIELADADQLKTKKNDAEANTSDLSTSSDFGDEDEEELDEDLANEELASGENHQAPVDETVTNKGEIAKISTPVAQVNGHGKEESAEETDQESECAGESIA